MKLIKKFTVMIMCLMLLSAVCIHAVSAKEEGTDYSDKLYNQKVGILKALGILDGKQDMHAIVQRGEFLTAALRLIGIDTYMVNPREQLFSDVPLNSEYAGAIYTAKEMNIVSGYDNGTFGPDNPIEENQAVKIVLSLLGYDFPANQAGGYPGGYNKLAADLMLLKNVQRGSEFTNFDLCNMMYNALEIKIPIQTSATVRGWSYDEDTTVLSYYFRLKEIKGIITSDRYSSLFGNDKTSDNTIAIDSKIYEYNYSDYGRFLGRNIIGYVNLDEDRIAYLYEDTRFSSIEINASEVTNVSRNSNNDIIINYTEGGTLKKTAHVKASAFEMFNNRAADLDEADFQLSSGKIILYNSSSNGREYDTAYIYYYVDYVVDTVGRDGNIYDKYKKNVLPLDIKNGDIKFSLTTNGEQIEPANLSEWAVLSVMADVVMQKGSDTIPDTVNAANYEILVGTQTVSGTLESYNEENVIVNGNRYEISKSYKEALISGAAEKMKPGRKVTLYMNVFGEAAAMKTFSDMKQSYGFVTALGYDEDTEAVWIKVYDWMGNFNFLTFAEKPIIDGKKVKGEKGVSAAIMHTSGTIVSFRLNEDNKINYFDTMKYDPLLENEEDSVVCHLERIDNVPYKIGNFSLDGKFSVSNETVVFVIPDDWDNEDLFAVQTNEYFINDTKYNVAAYNISDAKVAKVVLSYDSDGGVFDANSPVAFFEKNEYGMNQDGEAVPMIRCHYNGEVHEHFLNENTVITDVQTKETILSEALKKGDIIRLITNSRNEITKMERYVTQDTPFGKTSDREADFYYGKAYAKDGVIAAVTVGVSSLEVMNKAVDLMPFSTEKKIITVYDRENNTFYAGTPEDIVCYENTNDDSQTSTLFVHQKIMATKQILIIK